MPVTARRRSNSSPSSTTQRERKRSNSSPPAIHHGPPPPTGKITSAMLKSRFPVDRLKVQPTGEILSRTIAEVGLGLNVWKDKAGKPITLIQMKGEKLFEIDSADDSDVFLKGLWAQIQGMNQMLGINAGESEQIYFNVEENQKDQVVAIVKEMIKAVNKAGDESDHELELMEIEVTKGEGSQRIINFQIAKRPKRAQGDSVREKITRGEVLLKTIHRNPLIIPDNDRSGETKELFTDQMKELLEETTGQQESTDPDLLQNYRWAPFLHNLNNPRLGREAMREEDATKRSELLRSVGEPAGITGTKPGKFKIDPRTKQATPIDSTKKDISENTYNYTRKTATSLLPPSGKMAPYDSEDPNLTVTGLLFDLHKSDLRDEKYIFTKDARTVDRWWIGDEQTSIIPNDAESIGLKELKQQQTEHSYNEILTGVNLEGIVGVFYSSKDTRKGLDKLQGIARRQLIRNKAGRAVPLLEISSSEEPTEISLEEQLEFLNRLLSNQDALNALLKARHHAPWDGAKIEKNRDKHMEQIQKLKRELEAEIGSPV
jgi:hypothetical protein